MAQRNLRFDDEMFAELQREAGRRGINASALIREAIRNELSRGSQSEQLQALESRVAASLNRLQADVASSREAIHGMFAYLDTLVKVVLTCMPEPEPHALEKARVAAKDRHTKFVRQAAMAFRGDLGSTFSKKQVNGEAH